MAGARRVPPNGLLWPARRSLKDISRPVLPLSRARYCSGLLATAPAPFRSGTNAALTKFTDGVCGSATSCQLVGQFPSELGHHIRNFANGVPVEHVQ